MSGAIARMLVLLLLLASCGLLQGHKPSNRDRPKPGVEITLYRDHAVVAHRLDVTIPPASTAKVTLRIAAGVEPDDLYLVDQTDLSIKSRVALGAPSERPASGCDEVSCVMDGERACCARFKRSSEWEDDAPVTAEEPKKITGAPTEVELTIAGPREGVFSISIGYTTPRIAWDASYTVTTTASHRRAELRGALVVRNATGIAFPAVKLAVIDVEHKLLQDKQQTAETTKDDSPIAQPRSLDIVELGEGDSRFPLVDISTPVKSLLVFDPIGRGLDYENTMPVQDPSLGVSGQPATRVVENLAIERSAALSHLPGGPVRVFERKPDGALALLSEATLYGTETLVAAIDTVSIGDAPKVTGKRERRELTVDTDRKRIVEEFALTIDNARDTPIDIVLREHLYRGASWTIAYQSVFYNTKEGKQQIAMRTRVPARSKQTVVYVVVYVWTDPPVDKKAEKKKK